MESIPDITQSGPLSAKKLAELQQIAHDLGIKSVYRMRKSDLIAAIGSARHPHTASSQAQQAETSPKTTLRRRVTKESAEPVREATYMGATTSVLDTSTGDGVSYGQAEAATPLPEESDQQNYGGVAERPERHTRRRRVHTGVVDVASRSEYPKVVLDLPEPVNQGDAEQDSQALEENQVEHAAHDVTEIELPESDEASQRRTNRHNRRRDRERNDRRNNNRDRRSNERVERNERTERVERSERRSQEPELREDDVLAPIAGILDVKDNHAFVRTSGYLPGPNDVYVNLGNVRRWGLRPGDAVVGAVRQPREGERQRQKFNPLVRVDSVNGQSVEEAHERREFGKLTPLYPSEVLRMETTPKAITPRVIDLVAPIGKGQRGLIVSPPKAGKTMIIQQIAKAIEINNPDVHLMVVLVDERPEEVTDMRSIVKGEVIASTFDRLASDHTTVAELAIERAKRLVELGQDVVVLLDSLTRLSRAYNLATPASGRILSGGVDASALYPPKKFFGAARNLKEGGSLTIIASALVETGSKMDEVIFEEFKGTGNMELRLSRQLADRRIFPAIDVNASGTRREEMLLSPEELRIMWKLRRVLGTLEQQAALELVLGKLKDTQSNAEFLMTVQKIVTSASK